jgi:acetyl esterase
VTLDPEILALFAAAPPRPAMALDRGPGAAAAAAGLRMGNRPQGPLAFPGVTVSDVQVDGGGHAIPVRLYQPHGTGPFPTMLNFHGGGWVIGNLAMDDRRCARMAAEAGVLVASVDYRLAPEHPYPAAIEDGLAVLRWAGSGAGAFDADPQRLAISGSSSGGNIAAALALICRDRGGPALKFQLLNYPVTDSRLDFPSYGEFGQGPGVTAAMMAWFWDVYAGDNDRSDGRLSPLRATDVSGLPPTVITTAACDVLRDEAEAYGERLRQAGVPVILARYEGVPHGFLTLAIEVPQARAAVNLAIEHLKKTL